MSECRTSVRADHVGEQLAGEVVRALGGPALAVAEVRVDDRAGGLAVGAAAGGVDETSAGDAVARVEDLDHAARIAGDRDGDEVGLGVAVGAIEEEEVAGLGWVEGTGEALAALGPG